MSLNFDYSKVANPLPNGDDPRHAPLDEKKWHPVGDAIVWASLSVGLGTLDDKTIEKWEQRLNLLQAIDGPLVSWQLPDGKLVKGYVTRADLEAFKGLRVNVSAETDAQFLKKLLRSRPATLGKGETPAYEKAHAVAKAWFTHRAKEAPVVDYVPRDTATARAENGNPDA